jgi:hypothetical protein
VDIAEADDVQQEVIAEGIRLVATEVALRKQFSIVALAEPPIDIARLGEVTLQANLHARPRRSQSDVATSNMLSSMAA